MWNGYDVKNFSLDLPGDNILLGRERGAMVISDFTNIELDFLRQNCNFVNNETDLFELRSQGISLEEIAEALNLSVDGAKKISQKVNRKIKRVHF